MDMGDATNARRSEGNQVLASFGPEKIWIAISAGCS